MQPSPSSGVVWQQRDSMWSTRRCTQAPPCHHSSSLQMMSRWNFTPLKKRTVAGLSSAKVFCGISKYTKPSELSPCELLTCVCFRLFLFQMPRQRGSKDAELYGSCFESFENCSCCCDCVQKTSRPGAQQWTYRKLSSGAIWWIFTLSVLLLHLGQ